MTRYEFMDKAKEDIKEKLEYFNGYYCDLHNEVFNTDYVEYYTANAEEQLEEYGVFDALEEVQEYERMNFGELYTDISDPCRLLNMLYYIIGEDYMYNEAPEAFQDIINEHWNEEATEEINRQLIEALN